jgi:CBS-domain-containing membrane protein
MVDHDIGRLPVMERGTNRLIGMITRSDLLSAHRKRLREMRETQQSFPPRRVAPSRINAPAVN